VKKVLTQEEIKELESFGASVLGYQRPVAKVAPPARVSDELEVLKAIARKLDSLVEKETGALTVPPANVTLNPSPVTVVQSAVKKWKFDVVKVNERLIEITATAMES
jgi:3-phosphoglycerate kinase